MEVANQDLGLQGWGFKGFLECQAGFRGVLRIMLCLRPWVRGSGWVDDRGIAENHTHF